MGSAVYYIELNSLLEMAAKTNKMTVKKLNSVNKRLISHGEMTSVCGISELIPTQL